MNMEVIKEEGVVVKGRATIDTRPPFRSVKEAVALFGERVLVGEVYAKQLTEMQTKVSVDKEDVTSALETVSSELEETKQNLEKAREEGNYMANCIKSLREELEQTKRELRHLKSAKEVVIIDHPKSINPEIEELKFVENNPMFTRDDNNDHENEFQKKKFVTFASPPSLTREMIHTINHGDDNNNVGAKTRLGMGGITPPLNRKGEGKKKQSSPIMGWLFPRRKRTHNEGEDRSRKV